MKKLFVLFLFAIADGAYGGDDCTKDGVIGNCTLKSQCPSVIEEKGESTQNCADRGPEFICCVPSSALNPVLTTTKSSPTTTEYIPTTADYQDVGEPKPEGCTPIIANLTSKKSGKKAWNKCLDYQEQLVFPCKKSHALTGGMARANQCFHNADELIVAGENASLHEFPHMVLLRYGDDNETSDWFCGGALISENFVLTAGHCISNGENVPVAYAVLGTLKLSDDPNDGRRYKIKKIIKHPNYNPPKKYNDIALLELAETVPLDQFTVPACLHIGNTVNESKASATGWGQTFQGGNTSDFLQKVVLTKFEPIECTSKYGVHNHNMPTGFNPDSQICYGARIGENRFAKDTCQGDSGGPLHVKSEDIACMYLIIGVTSTGKTCGQRDEPGLYTRVDHFIDWIEDTVWPSRCNALDSGKITIFCAVFFILYLLK